jgi:uncharacterized membrane protein
MRDWINALAGPLAWSGALVASWMLTPPAGEHGDHVFLFAIDAMALVIAVIAGARALMRYRSLDEGASKFLALSGVTLASLSILLVIGLSIPNFMLAPGAEP